jgi:hypothetical protein
MSRAWKLALLLAALLLLMAMSSLGQDAKPVFTGNDRTLIESYYAHLIGTLAPGSVDRSPFPLGIEKALAAGSRVPVQLQKELEPLPVKLESQLSRISGDYRRYKLGRHVVLVQKADFTIADIIKNVAVKEPAK